MNSQNKLTKKRLLRFAIQGSVLGVFATAAILILTTEPNETWLAVRRFRWEMGLGSVGLIVLAWLCNGARIYLLCHGLGHRLRYRQALCVSMSSEFGIAATPAGVGGAAIRLSMLRYAGVPLALGTTMLTVDVAVDALFFAIIFPFALISLFNHEAIIRILPWQNPHALETPLVILFSLLLFLLLLYRSGAAHKVLIKMAFSKPLRRFRLFTRFHWVRRRLNKELRLMKAGYSHLFQVKRGALLITFILASVQWCCRYGVLSILLLGFGVSNNPFLMFILQGMLFSISLLVVLPGGGGGVEVLTAFLLKQMYPLAPVGVVILLWRVLTYHLYLFAGGAVFLYTFSHLHRLFPQTPLDEPEPDIDILDLNETEENTIENSKSRSHVN